MIRSISLCAFGLLLATGCARQSAVTTEEVIQALDMKTWTLQLPAEFSTTNQIRLMIKDAKDAEQLLCWAGSVRDSRIKLTIWRAVNEPPVWNYMVEDYHRTGRLLDGSSMTSIQRGSMTNAWFIFRQEGEVVKPGEIIMKGIHPGTDQCDDADVLNAGEYGLMFTIK